MELLHTIGLRIELAYVIIYLLAVCLIAFLMMGIDKWKAKHDRWRISEKSLFAIAFIGGAGGGFLGMKVFHHKTLHWYFKYGMPMLFMFQMVLLAAFAYWRVFLA